MFYWALSARLGQNFTQIQGISSWWWQNRFKESVSQQKTNTALVPSFQGRESWTLPVECTQWMVLLGSLGQDGVGAEQTLRTVFVLPVTRWVVLGPVCILCLNSLLQRGTYKTAPLKYLSGQMSSGQVVSTETSETGTQSQLPPPVQASFLHHSPCKGCKFLEGRCHPEHPSFIPSTRMSLPGTVARLASQLHMVQTFSSHQKVPSLPITFVCLCVCVGVFWFWFMHCLTPSTRSEAPEAEDVSDLFAFTSQCVEEYPTHSKGWEIYANNEWIKQFPYSLCDKIWDHLVLLPNYNIRSVCFLISKQQQQKYPLKAITYAS